MLVSYRKMLLILAIKLNIIFAAAREMGDALINFL